jgi:ankyrin repeat protein
MTMRRRHAVLFTILLLLVAFIGGTRHWLRAQQRQYALNRALIAALVKGDSMQALDLVEAGADPNTRCNLTPPLTLHYLWDQLIRRRGLLVNENPTALLIACGAWWKSQSAFPDAQSDSDDHTRLVLTMLQHGAKINVKDEGGWTPLLWALNADQKNTVVVLLEWKANVNDATEDGVTPLMIAVRSANTGQTVSVLLQHRTNVNVQDKQGSTPLIWALSSYAPKEVIQQLLSGGTAPNQPDDAGDTPLKLAQRTNRPDIMALLRHYGARK